MSYKRILVPVDGSPVSNRGLKEALKMARANHASVKLLHIVEEYGALVNTDAAMNVAPVLEGLRAAGKRTLSRIERRTRAAGFKPSTALVENLAGRVADMIVDEAKRWRPDVIVMGTHGRRGVKRMLLGSDAELVIRYSKVPVLLVPGRGS